MAVSASDRKNIKWLAKDIRFNFVPSKLFYDNPNSLVNMFTNDKNYLRQRLDFIVNIDIQHHLDDFEFLKFFLFVQKMFLFLFLGHFC